MSLIIVGDWIRREKRGVGHLVESLVAGDVVTRCGRRMRDEPTKTGGMLVTTIFNDRRCYACLGPAT